MLIGVVIAPSPSVLFDPGLLFYVQVVAVVKGTYFHLTGFCQLQPFLDKKDLVMVTHALVTSRLDYCNTLYVRQPLKMTRKLQLVQNSAGQMHCATLLI